MEVALDRTGRGPPLVLVHGLGATRAIWHRILPAIGRNRLVVTPDLPGFGGSPPAGRGFDLAAVADRVAEAVAGAAGGRFDLLGHSLGGAVAVTLAARRPELVDRLVLSAPAGFAPRSAPVARAAGALTRPLIAARRLIGVPLAGSALARRAILATVVHDARRLDPADARLILTSSRGATRLGAAVGAVAGADLSGELQALRSPLGLIWGERDLIFPVTTIATIRAAVGPVPVETIHEAGHATQLERPGEFADALERLLRRLEPAEPPQGRRSSSV